MWAGVAAAALAAPPATWPAREKSREAVPAKSVWARDYPQQWETFLDIRAEVDELAEELGMAAELLIRPATLRELVWVRLVALAPARSKAASRGSSDKQVQTIDDAERFLQRAGARAWQIELVLPAVAPYLFC